MRRKLACAVLAALLTHAPAGRALAHHVVDFIVTSNAEGGGQLLVSYDFRSVVPVSFNFALGDASVYSGTNPGFDTADGDEFFPGTTVPYPIFPPGVPIHVVLVDNDGGRTAMKINGQTLVNPGDAGLVGVSGASPPGDLHRHPEWQLLLTSPPGTFGEARIAFRVMAPASSYGESVTYALVLSNGHLPPPEYAGDRLDRESLRCQAGVGKSIEVLVRSIYAELRGCLDAVQLVRAADAARLDSSRALARAEARCAGGRTDAATMIGRVQRAEAKARAAITRRCGPGASKDLDDHAIAQHVGLARCRAEGIVAASYFRARTYLRLFTARDSQGGRPLHEYFPCVVQTAGEEEGPS
jgi:hypothetical protein